MSALSKWLQPTKTMTRLGRLIGVLVCTLALALAVVGHIDFAGAAFASPATQATSHHGGDDNAGPAMGLVPHCAAHSFCGVLMLAQPQELMPVEAGLIIAIEPDTVAASRPTAPPYHPPKS